MRRSLALLAVPPWFSRPVRKFGFHQHHRRIRRIHLDSTRDSLSALVPFNACDAVLAHFKAEALEQVGPYGLSGGLIWFGRLPR
jgi:hypothetical protein